jgi:predicted nucleotidyltransferase
MLPTHMPERDRAAAWALLHRLSDLLGDDLCDVWLFGSKARGDFTVDSDLDLLIVLRHLQPERRGIIRRLAARVSLDYDTLINTHLYEKARWQTIVARQDKLWSEIQRDGILLSLPTTQPTADR